MDLSEIEQKILDMQKKTATNEEAKGSAVEAVLIFASEERLRAIIREEIEAYEKQRIASIRAQGLPAPYWPHHEVKDATS